MRADAIRVVLVDDHEMVLDSLAARIGLDPDIEVVGTATTAQEGARITADLRPDVTLFDIDFPGVDSFDVIPALREAGCKTKIVFLTAHLSDLFVHQAMALKAVGYILKGDPVRAVTEGIKQVHLGGFAFSPSVQAKLNFDARNKSYSIKTERLLCALSIHQLAILRHLARGESVKQIALALTKSEKSVDSAKYRIMHKLDIHDRVELARYAIQEGLTLI